MMFVVVLLFFLFFSLSLCVPNCVISPFVAIGKTETLFTLRQRIIPAFLKCRVLTRSHPGAYSGKSGRVARPLRVPRLSSDNGAAV